MGLKIMRDTKLTVINSKLLQSRQLTLRAKGLAALILSLEGDSFDIDDEKIRDYLSPYEPEHLIDEFNELLEFGFLKVVPSAFEDFSEEAGR